MGNVPIHSSDELIRRAVERAKNDRRMTVVVAAAQDSDVIDAVAQARADGFLDGILVGDEEKIRALARELNRDLSPLRIVNEPDTSRAAHAAVRLAADGEADLIMKGFLPTSSLLKVVLDKQYRLRGANTLSHCAVLDIPGHHKMLNFTDGGMVVKPTPEQKEQILENAVTVGRALGLSPIKVAVSAVPDRDWLERVRAKLSDVIIDGPMSFEEATFRQPGESQGAGLVAGDADIFVVDTIEECNVMAKALINFAGAVFAGVIVGARVPVSLVSRTDTAQNKKASLAIACAIADFCGQTRTGER